MATTTDIGPRTPITPVPASTTNRTQPIQTVNAATAPSTQIPAAPQVPAPVTPTPTQTADGTNQQSASQQIQAFLANVPGLAQLDPTGALGAWMMTQVGSLAGQGIDSSTIVNTIESTMNNPNNDPTAKAVFDAIMPGYNQKIANGSSNADGTYTGIAGYIAYANQIQQYAAVADLPDGTVTAQSIGNMWANNVSSSEVSSRITQGVVAAQNAIAAAPEVGTYLANAGISPGGLAGYFLNPTNADATMQATLNSALAAGGAANTGFAPSLGVSQAAALGAFLSSSNQNGLGGTGSTNLGSVEQALTTNLATGTTGAAQMANAGFEQALPGQAAGPGTVSQNQLLGAVEGNVGDAAAARLATGTRTAGTGGGGGAVTSEGGVSGIGFGSSA